MKALVTVLVALVVLSFGAVEIAEAKRLGGGRSLGKSFSTSPYKSQQAAPAGGQQAAAGRRGFMGGMLGGLLAGGLFAWLLGGAFQGLQAIDILIFAGIAFLLFKLFKNMNRARSAAQGGRTAYAGSTAYGQPEPSGPGPIRIGGGTGDVPFNFPPDFQLDAFLEGARGHFRTLQEAWNRNDLETMREYFAPDLFAQISAERASLDGEQHTEVMFVDAELGRADHDATRAQISVIFRGRYRDLEEGVEEDIRDIWHLERDLTRENEPWLIVGIES